MIHETMPGRPVDWRVRSFDDARAIAKDVHQAIGLMAVAEMMRCRGVTDPVVHARAFRVVVDAGISDPISSMARIERELFWRPNGS